VWCREQFAGYTVLEHSTSRAGLMLSLGPRWSGGAPEDRAADILAALGPEVGALRWCHQIHGRLLASLSAGEDHPLRGAVRVGRCDGLLTADPGVAVMVWTADCVPVLLHGGDVVAAVHAGWRGAAAGIVPAAVRRFAVEYGIPPQRIGAALGPSVGACHYEVGPEVVDALSAADPGGVQWRHGRESRLLGWSVLAGVRPATWSWPPIAGTGRGRGGSSPWPSSSPDGGP